MRVVFHPSKMAMLKQFHSSRHRALIFDCDGTIGDNMGLYYYAWNRVLRELGATGDIPWDEFCSNGGRYYRDSLRDYGRRFGKQIDAEEFSKRLGLLYAQCLPYFLPVEPVVSFIRGDPRPMAVASSGRLKNVAYIVDRLGFRDRFAALVTQEDVTHGDEVRTKPAPDLFLIAAEKLNSAPGDCLVFDDSPLGGEAAKAAGMDFMAIPHDWWSPALRTFDLEKVKRNSS
jgi:HAD superfamily hydrolase (TIGR01509 family)